MIQCNTDAVGTDQYINLTDFHIVHQPSTIMPISPTMTKSETNETRKTIAVMIESSH